MNDVPTGLFLSFFEDAIAQGPHLQVRAGNAQTHGVMVDTGSQGIVLPKHAVGTDATDMPEPTPPTPHYSSSGHQYVGTWKLATVQVTGQNGATFTTAKPVPVFSATGMQRGKKILPLDPAMGMMGVGIRGLDQDAGNIMNAFLNLPQMVTGEFRTGYILSRFGAWFGYPDAEVANFQTFATNCAFHDEQGTPIARVTLTPAAGSQLAAYVHLGPLLMDTGLGEMILTTPHDQPPPDPGFLGPDGNLAAGVDVALALQDEGGTWRTFWEFNSGQCRRQADAPDYVRLVTPTPVPGKPPADQYGISNTGRHLLALFDYLVDLQFSPTGASGVVGLHRRPTS